ncbi:MAG: hypothetical protein K0S97_1890 [Chloroflexota bacterium]|nr:hypothetical protein [Chloroflexota bacterium]
MADEPGRTLHFVPDAPRVAPDDGSVTVVLDSTWTATGELGGNDRVIGIRGVGGRLLEDRDLITETAERLDAWASASGIVDKLLVEGTSMWFYLRLSVWVWFQQRILWTAIVDDLVRTVAPSRIVCDPGTDDVVIEAARLVAARDGLEIEAPDIPEVDRSGHAAPLPTPAARAPSAAASTGMAQFGRRGLGKVRRLIAGGPGSDASASATIQGLPARRRAMTERLDALASESGRLLVVLEHTRQRVETAHGPRDVNPYLSPVVNALRGSALEPIEIDLKARVDDDTWWEQLNSPDGARLLPSSAIWRAGEAEDHAHGDGEVEAGSAESWIAIVGAIRTPVVVHGVDLGPGLTGRVSQLAARWMPSKVRAVTSIRALLRRLRPAGVLLADEYHRQDWLTAARAENVPVAAIQHGMIYRGHNGYVHRERPETLALPDRTYVFGEWERDVLVHASVYRDDEVRVSGSPRLDLAEAAPDADAAALRAELGVRPGDRLVVLSGTYGPAYRRFHIPYALDRLLDRPWPHVHLVVKQHPGEQDRGPYEALVTGVTAARGFAPPPVSVVQHIDLYRLLRCADAHLGIHSTVLTEAVAAGTLNLLADTLAASDLLGYVEAGVAVPVRDGADLLAALDAPGAITPQARSAFLARHFREGRASDRLRGELLEWLA